MAWISDELRACYPTSGPIWAYIEHASRLSHTPPALHVASILPVVGYELCRRGSYIPTLGGPRGWFGIIAPSGVSKSSAVNDAKRFSKDWYERLHRHNPQSAPNPWISLNGTLPGVIRRLTEQPEEPIGSGRKCAILHHDEVTGILRREDTADALNELYNGDPVERNLVYLQKEDAEVLIKEPMVQAIVTSTPSALERAVRPETVEGGLYYRFLWLRERLRRGDLMPRKLDDPQAYDWTLRVWEQWWASLNGYGTAGQLMRRIVFTHEALDWLDEHLFHAFEDELLSESFEAGMIPRLHPMARHIAAMFAASVLQIHDQHITVTVDEAARAGNLVRLWYRHGVRIGEDIIAQTETVDRRQRRIMRALEKAGEQGLSRGEAYRLFGNRIRKDELERLFDELEDQHLARRTILHDQFGRAHDRYLLESYAAKRDEEHNAHLRAN